MVNAKTKKIEPTEAGLALASITTIHGVAIAGPGIMGYAQEIDAANGYELRLLDNIVRVTRDGATTLVPLTNVAEMVPLADVPIEVDDDNTPGAPLLSGHNRAASGTASTEA